MGVLTRFAVLALVLSACAQQTGAPSATPPSFTATPAIAVTITPGPRPGEQALLWGAGTYGVILTGPANEAGVAGAWEEVAQLLAAHRMVVVLSWHPTQVGIGSAIRYLEHAGADRVALVATGEWAGSIVNEHPFDLPIDQFICVSCDLDVRQLGAFPKLFIASQGEAAAAATARMAGQSAGAWNAELLVPGDASGLAILDGPGADALLDGILRRLEERR